MGRLNSATAIQPNRVRIRTCFPRIADSESRYSPVMKVHTFRLPLSSREREYHGERRGFKAATHLAIPPSNREILPARVPLDSPDSKANISCRRPLRPRAIVVRIFAPRDRFAPSWRLLLFRRGGRGGCRFGGTGGEAGRSFGAGGCGGTWNERSVRGKVAEEVTQWREDQDAVLFRIGRRRSRARRQRWLFGEETSSLRGGLTSVTLVQAAMKRPQGLHLTPTKSIKAASAGGNGTEKDRTRAHSVVSDRVA